jgi:putative ABC transport system ATP-binding protein
MNARHIVGVVVGLVVVGLGWAQQPTAEEILKRSVESSYPEQFVSPTSGRILIEGQDVSKLSPKELAWVRRRRLGFVFQTFNLVPVLTAYENIELPLLLLGVGAAERRRRVYALLEALGISELAHHRPDEMSGGQQQRVSIARALITEPALVLADEPTANLDSETGKAIIELMHELNKTHGTTFVFSTHDPKVMERASRLIHIRDGIIDSN